MLIQAGSNKAPYLIKNNGAGKQDAAYKSKLQIKKNPSW